MTPLWFIMAQENSRRSNCEFDLEKLLGSGSYGVVFQAKHKLDKQQYALKRIIIDSDADLAKFSREVEYHAHLEHKNILRYHSAWTEQIAATDLREHDSNFLPRGISRPKQKTHTKQGNVPNRTPIHDNPTTSSAAAHLEHSIDNETLQCQAEKLKLSSSSSVRLVGVSSSDHRFASVQHGMQTVEELTENLAEQTSNEDRYVLLLFIQLQLCDRTLRQWLEVNPNANRRNCLNYFCDILQGVQHIHSLDYVHWDLKASNVLLTFDPNSRAVISDFGLTTRPCLQQCISESVSSQTLPSTLTSSEHGADAAVNGTADNMKCSQPSTSTQVRNKEAIDYGQRLDLRDLGVIFLQLICSVRSDEERHKLVSEAYLQPPKLPVSVSEQDLALLLSVLNTKQTMHVSQLLNSITAIQLEDEPT